VFDELKAKYSELRTALALYLARVAQLRALLYGNGSRYSAEWQARANEQLEYAPAVAAQAQDALDYVEDLFGDALGGLPLVPIIAVSASVITVAGAIALVSSATAPIVQTLVDGDREQELLDRGLTPEQVAVQTGRGEPAQAAAIRAAGSAAFGLGTLLLGLGVGYVIFKSWGRNRA